MALTDIVFDQRLVGNASRGNVGTLTDIDFRKISALANRGNSGVLTDIDFGNDLSGITGPSGGGSVIGSASDTAYFGGTASATVRYMGRSRHRPFQPPPQKRSVPEPKKPTLRREPVKGKSQWDDAEFGGVAEGFVTCFGGAGVKIRFGGKVSAKVTAWEDVESHVIAEALHILDDEDEL